MKLELTEQEINNLMSFLNRTNLQGSEVGVFLPLVQKIDRQVQAQRIRMPMPQPKPQKLNKHKAIKK